jgi:putative membrane protein
VHDTATGEAWSGFCIFVLRKRRLDVKRFVSLLVLALACHKAESPAVSTDTATTSTMAVNETTGTATGTGSTGGGASTLSEREKKFVMAAAQGGMAEVSLGSLAAQNGTSADVKSFGNRMVSDHGKAGDELKALATNKGLALPMELDDEAKKTQDALSKQSGKDFDKAYMADMVADHEKDVAEFQKAMQEVKDPELQAWVSKTLPTLQDHLRMAKAVRP